MRGHSNNSTKATAQEGEGKQTDTAAQMESCRAASERLATKVWTEGPWQRCKGEGTCAPVCATTDVYH